MIDVIFCLMGLLTLVFMSICIIGMYEILRDSRAERKRKDEIAKWNRRLP